MNMPTARPITDTANHLADQAAQGAERAIRSTQRVANDALDNIAQGAQNMQAKASPVINRVADDAEHLARRGIDAVRDGSQQLRAKARNATDGTIVYIRHEPVKAVLIAAGIGAGLAMLFSLLSRSRG